MDVKLNSCNRMLKYRIINIWSLVPSRQCFQCLKFYREWFKCLYASNFSLRGDKVLHLNFEPWRNGIWCKYASEFRPAGIHTYYAFGFICGVKDLDGGCHYGINKLRKHEHTCKRVDSNWIHSWDINIFLISIPQVMCLHWNRVEGNILYWVMGK
jgi:hypothetical protein